jgi:hypothetical protein
MNTNEYLQKILAAQTLGTDSEELKALQEHRADVEALLRKEFKDCSPTIRYGGSKAKGTMIRESYDLDLICYFPHDDTKAGATLEDIYNNTKRALSKSYVVEPKQSAIRLKGLDTDHYNQDFHIDVVPGRFTDEDKSDAYLYQAAGEKKRLKTNLDVHIEHVRDSGVTDAIRLIKLLESKKSSSLSAQLEHVWKEFRDNIDDLTVKDPANPEGNDLSEALNSAKAVLQSTASQTLSVIASAGWEVVFGTVASESESNKLARLRGAAASVAVQSKPWFTT